MKRAAMLAVLCTACSVTTSQSPPTWDTSGARIALQRVIATQRDTASPSRMVMALATGRTDEPLFQRPYGIAWDGADLLVTDPAAHRVVRIGAKTTTTSPDGAVEDPVGIAVCGDSIAVTDARGGAVALLDHTLRRRRWLANALARPTGVACSAGEFFVVETAAHRVVVLDAAGIVQRTIGARGDGTGQFNFPTSIALAGQKLFVGDTLNFRIQQFDRATGVYLASFGSIGDSAGEMPRIKGIAVDAEQRIWVTDAHLDQITLYSIDGQFLSALGRTGQQPGELAFPAGIAISAEGLVAVADSLNRRLQVFRVAGGSP